MKQDTQRYTVSTSTAILHNGVRYEQGSDIELTGQEAEKLSLYIALRPKEDDAVIPAETSETAEKENEAVVPAETSETAEKEDDAVAPSETAKKTPTTKGKK